MFPNPAAAPTAAQDAYPDTSPHAQSGLLRQLNPDQLAAVTLPPVSALILAGAGSGKTRVLTTRIAWLIATGQVSAHGILAVTFTNKAAREMIARVEAQVPVAPRALWLGTFHGLCHRLLRMHWRDAGLTQTFQIMDSADQLAAIKRLLRALNLAEDTHPPRELMYFINSQKEAGLRPPAVEAWNDDTRQKLRCYEAYEQQCQREGTVDFAELLLRAFELLRDNLPLRVHYQQRFRHLLVDEFQDTNGLQYQWLRLLAGVAEPGKAPQAAVFAVGDDDQSIYAFRGARVGNMHDFVRDFQVSHTIRLEQNYRSSSNILDAANALIAHNSGRLGKNLWTESSAGDPLRVYQAHTDSEEAQFIVEEVQQLHREGIALSQIAVLYRSNAQSRVLEHALFQAGLPYRVYGGLRFFERQEIKHALAYLRLLHNPDDDAAFLRVVNFPTRGIGARTVEQLTDHARSNGVSLWQAACSSPGGRSAAALARFLTLIDTLQHETAEKDLPKVVQTVIQHSGLVEHYQTEREGQERLENLDQLVSAAALFIVDEALPPLPATPAGPSSEEALPAAEDRSPIQDFLAHASLEAGEHHAAAGQDALQLMTVHAAKGLEFDAVFLSGLEEGLFPHDNSLNEAHALEEERRLAYVALTRARARLYLSLAQSRMLHGQTRYSIASRFLDEIPSRLLKWLSAPAARGYDISSARATPEKRVPSSLLSPCMADTPLQGLRIGATVEHPRFGLGVVIDCEGSGARANVQVNFAAAGIKWLMLEYAHLSVYG